MEVAGSNTAAEDAEWVRQTLAGRGGAFDRLVERHQRRAVSVALRLVGNLHDALEVVQDAFIRAYRGLAALEEPQRFGSWFLRIVTNLALNYRRDRAVGGPRFSLEDCLLDGDRAERATQPTRGAARPDDGMAAEELAAIVEREVAALPDAQRTALVLFSIEQLPQKEVAGIMDCSVEAVKWHVFQARKKLKERLAEYL